MSEKLRELERIIEADNQNTDAIDLYIVELMRISTVREFEEEFSNFLNRYKIDHLSKDAINHLLNSGFNPGVYFEITSDGSLENVIHVISRSVIWKAHGIFETIGELTDKVDGIPVSHELAYARKIGESNRPIFVENQERLRPKLTFDKKEEAKLKNEITKFSRFVRKLKRKNNYIYSIFLPLWALNKAFSIEVTNTTKGFSRSNRWEEAESKIFWTTQRQFNETRKLLFERLQGRTAVPPGIEIELKNPKKFRRNTLLNLDLWWH